MVRSALLGAIAASLCGLLFEALYHFGGNTWLRVCLLCVVALGSTVGLVVLLLQPEDPPTS